MYATYQYNAGATAAQIGADIILLLTGTTSASSLSASCNQPGTTISASYEVAGWTVYDAAASASSQVLRAPCADDPAQYKYIEIGWGTAGYIILSNWESWNAGTHVGTNRGDPNSTSFHQRTSISTGGFIYVSASARRAMLFGIYGATYGSSNGQGWLGVVERARGVVWWDTTVAAYPLGTFITPWGGLANSNAWVSSPRMKNLSSNTDSTGVSLKIDALTKGTSGTYSNVRGATKLYNSSGVLSYVINKMWVISAGDIGFVSGEFSTLCDLWLFQPGFGSSFDEIVYNGKTYVLWANTTNVNSQGSLLVPKG